MRKWIRAFDGAELIDTEFYGIWYHPGSFWVIGTDGKFVGPGSGWVECPIDSRYAQARVYLEDRA